MSVLDATQARRRFLILSATRWLPTGLLSPVFIILLLERGLTLTEIGLVAAVSSVTVTLLEFPTGGWADALGRRPVLLLGSAFNLVSVAILAATGDLRWILVAFVLEGVYRALESGPLESWYVDASLDADQDADLEEGLTRRGVVTGVAIAAGALGSAAIAGYGPTDPLDALVLPVILSFVFRLVDVVALALLVEEVPRRHRPERVTTRQVLGEARRLLRGHPGLLALVGIELLWGAGMTGVEVFTAPRLVELLGGARSGAAALGAATAVAWLVSAAGSSATPWLVRILGGRADRAGVVTRLAQGASLALMAVVIGPVGVIAGYLGFYLVHGSANVVHYSMVHRLVHGRLRTTIVSANSFAGRIGGAVAVLALGALADRAGTPAAFGVCAVLLAAGFPLYLVAGRSQPVSGPAARPTEAPDAAA